METRENPRREERRKYCVFVFVRLRLRALPKRPTLSVSVSLVSLVQPRTTSLPPSTSTEGAMRSGRCAQAKIPQAHKKWKRRSVKGK